jgi:hypothetical protein
VADHPLRPATDHCLGRPLPHQLANPTRAPPVAINLSRNSLARAPAYAVLAEVSLGYPPQQGRFPRATHPCATHDHRRTHGHAFDLHVLSMPPAFVLSQDQTLMFNPRQVLSDPPSIADPPRAHTNPCSRDMNRPTRAVTTLTSSIRKRRDNPPPPAHPFSLPTMSINKPVDAARLSGPRRCGRRLISPSP